MVWHLQKILERDLPGKGNLSSWRGNMSLIERVVRNAKQNILLSYSKGSGQIWLMLDKARCVGISSTSHILKGLWNVLCSNTFWDIKVFSQGWMQIYASDGLGILEFQFFFLFVFFLYLFKNSVWEKFLKNGSKFCFDIVCIRNCLCLWQFLHQTILWNDRCKFMLGRRLLSWNSCPG